MAYSLLNLCCPTFLKNLCRRQSKIDLLKLNLYMPGSHGLIINKITSSNSLALGAMYAESSELTPCFLEFTSIGNVNHTATPSLNWSGGTYISYSMISSVQKPLPCWDLYWMDGSCFPCGECFIPRTRWYCKLTISIIVSTHILEEIPQSSNSGSHSFMPTVPGSNCKLNISEDF